MQSLHWRTRPLNITLICHDTPDSDINLHGVCIMLWGIYTHKHAGADLIQSGVKKECALSIVSILAEMLIKLLASGTTQIQMTSASQQSTKNEKRYPTNYTTQIQMTSTSQQSTTK